MRSTAASIIVSSLTVWSAAASAQESDIVVRAERLRQEALAYTAAVAVAPRASDQYARWNAHLCPRVAGLAPEAAQALIDHIARRAYQVGIQAESAGCEANLIIVVAPDARQFAQEVVASRRDLLGYYTEDDQITEGRAALEMFANAERAVRWWHVSRTTTADGRQLADSSSQSGRISRAAEVAAGRHARSTSIAPNDAELLDAIMGGSGLEGADAVRSQGTRLRRATRQDLSFALVIVDASAVAEHAPSAVADYLAMTTLVQLNAEADMSAFPTILNLFTSVEPPEAMTAWDLAYLQALYSATREAASAQRQRAEIARHMADEVVRVTAQTSP